MTIVTQNLQSLPLPFALNERLSINDYSVERPTVVAIIRNQSGEVLLVLPQKAAATHANAGMFPQGPIKVTETPLQSLDELLQRECSLSLADLEPDSIQAIAVDSAVTRQGLKRYYIIFAILIPTRHLALTAEARLVTRNMFFVGDPFCVWNKIADARLEKQRMMLKMLLLLARKHLLVGEDWAMERFIALRAHMQQTI